MKQYLDLIQRVLDEGVEKADRTGVGTRSVFGHQMRFNLAEGFPLLTTKKVHTRSVFGELLWFLRGETNIAWLHENKIRIWDEWADEHGELGPIYGYQWRSWPTPDGRHVDQMHHLITNLKANPDSRRHIISAWNVAQLDEWPCPRVTCCSSSTSLTESSAVRCTSARPTSFWASRSTWPPTPC